MYPNQKIIAPFGDIYSVNTPYIDKVSDRLYREQKQKEAQEQADIKMLDNEFSKNLSNIRDADIPDLVVAYNDWKTAKKKLIRNPNASPEEQFEVLRKKGNMYAIISKSKAFRSGEELNGEGIVSKRYNYIPGAHGRLAEIMRTPLSKMQQDADPLGELLYRGDTYKNAGEDIKKSLGAMKLVYGEYKPVDDKGIEIEADKYESFINTPKQVKDYYKGVMGNPEANLFYSNQVMNLPPNALIEMQAKYDALPDEYWQRRGLEKEDLRYNNPDDIADVASTYLAQKAAVENVPRNAGVHRKTNVKATADYKFEIWKKQQPIKLANEKEMAATRDYYKNKSEEEVVKDVSAFVDKEIEFAKNNPVPLNATRPMDEENKKRLEGGTQYLSPYKLRTSPATLQLFKSDITLIPKDIYVNPENGNLILKETELNGGDREITRKEYEAVLVNKIFNSKIKLNQIETDRQVDGDKKKTEIKSSSKKSKWSSFAVPNK